MPGSAPKWVISDDASIQREIAPYRHMTHGERLQVLAAVCRDAVVLAAANPHPARVFARIDPLPDSSRLALARLRSECRRGLGR